MAADDPTTAGHLLTRAWDLCKSDDDPEIVATVALLNAIHWYGRLDAAATVDWCERTLASMPPATSSYSVAVTYLVHGLGFSGRTAESVAAAVTAEQRPGDVDHLWLNPRTARGLQRLVDDDFAAARSDLESVANAASRLGLLNTSAFSFAYLAPTEWMTGAWDDASLHAERAVAINLESDFRFMQLAVTGIAVLVPAGRGDWSTAESYLRLMADKEDGYERSIIALGMSRARIGEARGDASAVLAALDPVAGSGTEMPRMNRDSGPGRICTPTRWWPRNGCRRRTLSCARTRTWPPNAGGDRPLPDWPGPGAGSRRPQVDPRVPKRPSGGRCGQPTVCMCRSNGPGSNWPRAVSCAEHRSAPTGRGTAVRRQETFCHPGCGALPGSGRDRKSPRRASRRRTGSVGTVRV